MRLRDRSRGQVRIAQVRLDEGVDLGRQRSLPCMGRQVDVERVGQRRGQHVEGEGREPGGVRWAEFVHAQGELPEELRGQRTDAPVARDADRGQLPQIPFRQGERCAREPQKQQPLSGTSGRNEAR